MSVQLFSAAKLATLSLDAAIALDRIARHQTVDMGPIRSLVLGLESPMASNPEHLELFSDPISADILTTTVSSTSAQPVTEVEDIERAVGIIIHDLRAVAEHSVNDHRVSLLKNFCLTFHQALLNELNPFKHQTEWAAKEVAFA